MIKKQLWLFKASFKIESQGMEKCTIMMGHSSKFDILFFQNFRKNR